MTSINEKLGLKRAGKRWMMKLPKNLAERAALTSAQCPVCHERGIAEYVTGTGVTKWLCTWCAHTFTPTQTEQAKTPESTT
jgi:ribosomal protein L37AE/L43A